MPDTREMLRTDLVRSPPLAAALEELSLEEFSVMELEDRLEFGICNDNCECNPGCPCEPDGNCPCTEPDGNCPCEPDTICPIIP